MTDNNQNCASCAYGKRWTEQQTPVNKIPRGKVRCTKRQVSGQQNNLLNSEDSWCDQWETREEKADA